MSTTTFEAMTRNQVECWLYITFGPIKAWSDFLADCDRDRADFHGLQLHPVCYLRSSTGRAKRPVYDRQEVKDFIVAAHAQGATLARDRKPEVVRVEIKVAELVLPPRSRSACRVS